MTVLLTIGGLWIVLLMFSIVSYFTAFIEPGKGVTQDVPAPGRFFYIYNLVAAFFLYGWLSSFKGA